MYSYKNTVSGVKVGNGVPIMLKLSRKDDDPTIQKCLNSPSRTMRGFNGYSCSSARQTINYHDARHEFIMQQVFAVLFFTRIEMICNHFSIAKYLMENCMIVLHHTKYKGYNFTINEIKFSMQ